MKQVLEVSLYNVTEAAALLGVSPQTVRKYIKEERLQAQRIGRGLFIAEPSLKSFLQGAVNNSRQ
ncbi:helix-turn-helix domain-containing protein [Neolewinella litorea]|uniref:DNA-binding protein n=1 Tax=Neolewinella litorea TaxID=2562452 RepID=A0A4S4N861_9BACT|nr:DNA-binding protein [Neolewinella litorea]